MVDPSRPNVSMLTLMMCIDAVTLAHLLKVRGVEAMLIKGTLEPYFLNGNYASILCQFSLMMI